MEKSLLLISPLLEINDDIENTYPDIKFAYISTIENIHKEICMVGGSPKIIILMSEGEAENEDVMYFIKHWFPYASRYVSKSSKPSPQVINHVIEMFEYCSDSYGGMCTGIFDYKFNEYKKIKSCYPYSR